MDNGWNQEMSAKSKANDLNSNCNIIKIQEK